MNFTLKISDVKSINELQGYWTSKDCMDLLEELDISDATDSNPSELRELLEMALSDLEPHESAEILLRYKLKNKLNDGQIRNLSHEMTGDNEAEENPNISIHYPLFNINQLLHKAYNGIFPNARATRIKFELNFKGDGIAMTKEIVLKSLSKGLSDKSPLIRLFENQLNGKEQFQDAEEIIWELHHDGQSKYTIIASDYWVNEEDIIEYELAGSIKQCEESKSHGEKI